MSSAAVGATNSKIDPITLELNRHGLLSATAQVDANIMRTAYSPYIHEYKHYAVGLEFRAFTPHRDQYRHDGWTDEQADQAETFEPAENAEQHPQERQARRAADQKWAHEVVSHERQCEAYDQQDDGGSRLPLNEQKNRAQDEYHRRTEWHCCEHGGDKAEQSGMRKAGCRVGDAKQ